MTMQGPTQEPERKFDEDTKDLTEEYKAIVAYHGDLVKLRFTLASILLGASMLFLSRAQGAEALLVLGLVSASWLLELRNRTLIKEMLLRGKQIENQLKLGERTAAQLPMFNSMDSKPMISPKIFGFEVRYGALGMKLISHSFGLDLLHLTVVFAAISHVLTY